MPDTLRCVECSQDFRGHYRKGNLARHKRHKHKGIADVMYNCEEDGCDKSFVSLQCADNE